MESIITSASIVWDDLNGIQYRVCKLDCTVWDDDSFEYVFTPNYRVIDMLDVREYGGIPGLDLDLRRDRYIRRNMEPVFMTERSPSRNRVDLWELLESVGLDHYNRLEWLIRTDLRYCGMDSMPSDTRNRLPSNSQITSPRNPMIPAGTSLRPWRQEGV